MAAQVHDPVEMHSLALAHLLARCRPLSRLTASAGLTAMCTALGMAAAFGVQALMGVTPVWPRGPYRVSPGNGLVFTAIGASATLLAAMLWFVWRPKWVPVPVAPGPPSASRARMIRRTAVSMVVAAMGGVAISELKGVPVVPGDRMFLMMIVWLLLAAALCATWVPAVFRLDSVLFVRASGLPLRVVCPECGYDLRGQSNLTCPECGRRYALDELLRAQAPADSAARITPHRSTAP